MSKNIKKWSPNLEKSRSGGGLGALGGDLGTKNLSKAVLADFSQFGPGSDRQKSPKMRPSWGQVGAKMLQVGAKMTNLRPFGELS